VSSAALAVVMVGVPAALVLVASELTGGVWEPYGALQHKFVRCEKKS
jgi:hypothetical protein